MGDIEYTFAGVKEFFKWDYEKRGHPYLEVQLGKDNRRFSNHGDLLLNP